MTDIAYYSVVQYIADAERREAVNVGALLEVDGAIEMTFLTDRPQLNGAADVVRRFEQTLQQLVADGSLADPETLGTDGLRALANRRFPHFVVTEPRPVALSASPSEILGELASRVVDEPAHHAGSTR
jgi:hypothetical protein